MKVRFFARLREQLGSDSLELPGVGFPMPVSRLRQQVCEHVGEDFAETMRDPNVFCAVNQQVADETTSVQADDEVAFFPPVTGG